MNYNALRARADALITKYSTLTITLSRVDTDGYTEKYDPDTDTMKWYKNGIEATAPTATTHVGSCIATNTNEYFVARGYTKETDKIFLTSGIPKPLKNDRVTVDGVSYTVYQVRPVSPGGTDVMYRIYARV